MLGLSATLVETQNCLTASSSHLTMEVPSNIEVGHRFSLSNDRGTIRYIGPVADTKGIWLGVEWDDPSRGKHDGVSKDTRYFHCR